MASIWGLLFFGALHHARPVSQSHLYSDDLKQCEFKRDDTIACMIKYGDINEDRKLDVEEIGIMKKNMLYFYEKFVALLHPDSEIMEHCDYNRDGFIDEDDFYKSYKTCMPFCFSVTDFNYYICSRAEYANYQKPKPKQ